MQDLFKISGRVMVITGGTGILGSVIASYLAGEGASVVILGRRREAGEALVNEIRRKGGEALFLETDVMDADRLTQNRDEILARYGRIDVLLNAAGGNMSGANIPPEKTFFDLDMNQFDQVVRLNLTGSVLPTQIFLQPMVQQKKGVILNFSSMAAFRPMT
ncbi:MAG: SDR family NAD(P)-dependent oxidoreductase, partial [Proteiniphilum sp.]|nr:SDR family NAD(P)-dependent oxidoreductase [Proteiniphilum sp.]